MGKETGYYFLFKETKIDLDKVIFSLPNVQLHLGSQEEASITFALLVHKLPKMLRKLCDEKET